MDQGRGVGLGLQDQSTIERWHKRRWRSHQRCMCNEARRYESRVICHEVWGLSLVFTRRKHKQIHERKTSYEMTFKYKFKGGWFSFAMSGSVLCLCLRLCRCFCCTVCRILLSDHSLAHAYVQWQPGSRELLIITGIMKHKIILRYGNKSFCEAAQPKLNYF